MHLTTDESFESNMFELTGEALIRLIYPSDSKRLQLFKQHLNTEDHEAQDFFNIMEDSAKLHLELKKWKQGHQATWIWRHWLSMFNCSQDTETWWSNRKDNVWVDPPSDEDGNSLDMSKTWTYTVLEPYSRAIDLDRYSPNMDHPWVQDILHDMSTFRIQSCSACALFNIRSQMTAFVG